MKDTFSSSISTASPGKNPTIRQLAVAVLLSLFVCPGLGHRYLGRDRAYIIVLILFFGAFLIIAGAVYSLAREYFAKYGQSLVLNDIQRLLDEAFGKAATAYFAFVGLVLVYIGAPIEIIWRGLFSRRDM